MRGLAERTKAPTTEEPTRDAAYTPPPLDVQKSRNVRHKMSSLVDGSALHDSTKGKRWWKTPQGLEADVAFWRDVYTKYSTAQVVLHDPKYLYIVFDVLDFSATENNPDLTKTQKRALRKDRVQSEMTRINTTLEKLSKNREAALRTKLGRKIATLYATVNEPNKFKEAHERGVRSQTGQSDKFKEGLKRSGAYLGEIELIFKSYGLPRELTRLIFVESMFQMNARSSVGAGGIWQFMPGTGKKYLRINRFADERFDPILATHAAAKLLRRNYEALGTWPLAINAYNAGRGRLMQAVQSLGTNDIATIIKQFEHPSYGFASRNFFLEFVAAREIVDNANHYFGTIDFDDPLSYDVVELPFHISLVEVSKLTGISLDELYALNPSFSDRVFGGGMLVPRGSTVRVPDGSGDRFVQLASKGLKTSIAPLAHTVARGESLKSIALMYGVPEMSIREANPSLKRRPRRGQRLYIPFD